MKETVDGTPHLAVPTLAPLRRGAHRGRHAVHAHSLAEDEPTDDTEIVEEDQDLEEDPLEDE